MLSVDALVYEEPEYARTLPAFGRILGVELPEAEGTVEEEILR